MKQITRGALKKMVQEEIGRQKKLREQNVSASTPGYLTPRFLKKRDNEH
jgi:hypothetical protein